VRVHLPYGRSGLDVDLPDYAHVLLPAQATPLPDPQEAVRLSLAQPLNSKPLRVLVRSYDSVALVVSDITRPVPNRILLSPILETIADKGVPREQVVIVNATGMHRGNSGEELASMLGEEIANGYRVVNHDARDRSSLTYLKSNGRGAEVWLNRDYLCADVRILTGFVEPHIFAGYSGGGKAVLPGVAGAEIILSNHGADMLADPRSTWCHTEGNPIFEEIRSVALASRPTFLVNVTLNERKEMTGVFAGELAAAHDAAIAQAASQALRPISHLYDIVVSTNLGWAADINLYQSVKGMSVAAQALNEDGTIVLTAECAEGLGNQEFIDLLLSEPSFPALMEKIHGLAQNEQWAVQCLAMVSERAEVYLHSSLSQDLTERAHLRYCADIGATVSSLAEEFRAKNGRDPAIAVLPYGQLTVPRRDG